MTVYLSKFTNLGLLLRWHFFGHFNSRFSKTLTPRCFQDGGLLHEIYNLQIWQTTSAIDRKSPQGVPRDQL